MTLGFNITVDVFDIDIEPVSGFMERGHIVKRIQPDLIAGSDNPGDPHIFYENKLRAGFSDYQPNEYLARLPSDRPSAYFCTAPENVFRNVVCKTRQRARRVYALDTMISRPYFIYDRIANSRKSMIYITWETSIEFMYEGAAGLRYTDLADEAYLLTQQFEDRYLDLTA